MRLADTAARLEALGNPTRLMVFQRLVRAGDTGMPVGRLQEELGVAASTLTHHLQKLIVVGLIWQERRSTVLICRANYDMMRDVVNTLVSECCADTPTPADSLTSGRGSAKR